MAMNEDQKYHLEDFLDRMKSYRARHTELITVYVPAGMDINIVTRQLESEKSTAANIKSTSTRKNVEDALESLIRICKQTRQTPKYGVCLFAGNVSQIEGQDDFLVEVFEPPEEMNMRLYRCDQTFVLDPLFEMLEVKELYGLLVVEKQGATIGLLIGKKIKILQRLDSMVPGKTNKGGQSSQRYARIRDNMAKEFYRKIAETMKQEFYPLGSTLKGILIGGPGPTKEDFLKEGQLMTVLFDKILGVKDIGYADDHGIELLVEASRDLLESQEIIREKKILERFFNMLGKEREKTAYGAEVVKVALGYGAVDTMLLSKKLDKHIVKEFEDLAKEISVNVDMISYETEEGQQFYNLSGIGAMLRFKLA
jgi:peptide chain release factor subunit 1